jgi:hypothetical protein
VFESWIERIRRLISAQPKEGRESITILEKADCRHTASTQVYVPDHQPL